MSLREKRRLFLSAWLAMANSARPGPACRKFHLFFTFFCLTKLLKFVIIYIENEREVFEMKRLWEVILPNKIIYIYGKKSQILVRFHTIITITHINEKQLFEVLEQGVAKISKKHLF